MNKKQLIVGWAMGILVCLTFFITEGRCLINPFRDYSIFKKLSIVIGYYKVPIIVSVIIIGGLLIYTLRDKERGNA